MIRSQPAARRAIPATQLRRCAQLITTRTRLPRRSSERASMFSLARDLFVAAAAERILSRAAVNAAATRRSWETRHPLERHDDEPRFRPPEHGTPHERGTPPESAPAPRPTDVTASRALQVTIAKFHLAPHFAVPPVVPPSPLPPAHETPRQRFLTGARSASAVRSCGAAAASRSVCVGDRRGALHLVPVLVHLDVGGQPDPLVRLAARRMEERSTCT